MKKFLIVPLLATVAILSGCKGKGGQADTAAKVSSVVNVDSLKNDSANIAAAKSDSLKTDSAKTASAEDKHTEAYIKNRLGKMYKASMRMGAKKTKYLTKAFRKAYNAPLSDGAEIGAIDYDIWLRTQDSENPVAVVKCVKVIDDTHAGARVAVYPMGKRRASTNVRVTLAFERGDWYVDNFIDKNGNDRKLLRNQ